MENPAKQRTIWPTAVFAATSAVFVALAGAFLVGALLILTPELFMPADAILPPESRANAEPVLYAVYGGAVFCFAVALASLALAVKKAP